MSASVNQVGRRRPAVATEPQTVSDDQLTEEADEWRNGPAKYWYDMINAPEDISAFDYGFQLKSQTETSVETSSCSNDSEDAFALVSQISWERQVIWDSDVVRQKVLKNLKKPTIAGWIPVEEKRTAPEFITHVKKPEDTNVEATDADSGTQTKEQSKCDKNKKKTKKVTFNGCQPNTRKRKDISSDDCQVIPAKVPTLRRAEEPIEWLTTLPEENRDLMHNRWEDDVIWDCTAMDRIPQPKVIPFNGDDEYAVFVTPEMEVNENSNDSLPGEVRRQLVINLNISNDQFYASVNKADQMTTHEFVIIHSVPALKLHPLCFPTCVQSTIRPVLTRSRTLPPNEEHELVICGQYTDSNCNQSDEQKSRDLSKYLIKSVADLTASHGHVVLMEYCEEDPPLLNRVGMGSQIFNYFKKSENKTHVPPEHRFAQNKAISESPFIGDIGVGKRQMALETALSRSPIWEHRLPETDFLVIRTEDSYYIREADGLFVVGQQLPMREVPKPSSNGYRDFVKQFAKKFIYDYFDANTNGRTKYVRNLDIELTKAFPNFTKNKITNILQEFTIKESNERFRLKSDVPFDNQINDLLTPENCCAYYSATIAEKQFKDLGYGDRLILGNEEQSNKFDRLLTLPTAPWNTSVAYIAAYNKKKWLNVCDYHEDGSLVFTNQSYKEFKDRMPAIKKCQPVTDRTINRMTLQKAHEWLISYGITKDRVKKLKNTIECRELIKELSANLTENGRTLRMSKVKTAEQHYKLECQKVFDLHSYMYSREVCESDESGEEEDEEESESDADLEEYAKDLEEMMLTDKSYEQIEEEKEERERLELVKLLVDSSQESKKDKNQPKESFKGKVLKIHRTFEFNGKKETRTETVTAKDVIETYVRIRRTKSDDFIRNLSFVKNHSESGLTVKKKTKKPTVGSTNKKPPKPVNGVVNNHLNSVFVESPTNNNNENIDITNDNWDINESVSEFHEESQQLVEVVGTKLKFAKSVVQDANQRIVEEELRVKREQEEERREIRTDYFTPRRADRRRIDPLVKINDIFDGLIVRVRKSPDLDENIDYFDRRIKPKDVPDYYDIVEEPMFLQDMRQKCTLKHYKHRDDFLKDADLIHFNAVEYNGAHHEISVDAKKMCDMFRDEINKMDETLTPLEVMIKSG